MEKGNNCRCPIRIYLGLVYFICYGLGVLELVTGTGKFYRILGVAFTFLPVLMSLITRRITGRKGKFHLSLKVWKNAKACTGVHDKGACGSKDQVGYSGTSA